MKKILPLCHVLNKKKFDIITSDTMNTSFKGGGLLWRILSCQSFFERRITMATITVIPAKDNRKEEQSNIRVAAYCRVSTDRDAQESSYEIQKAHYQELIERTPGWFLAGIYADEGISGTSVKHREAFKKMMHDSEKGLIDLIVTKSISRFARNTIDCLRYARMLKTIGVPVYFEKENINTMDSGGEFLLTVMASLAQQESISLSQNVRLGLQFRYQQGKVLMGFSRFLGFKKDERGEMKVVEEEAVIVRKMYEMLIDRASYNDICEYLTGNNIAPPGGKKWYKGTIRRMLSNEKYAGDALLQKTCTTDVLNKVREKNIGIAPQYYIRDHHEPIVSHEVWLKAQAEMSRRNKSFSPYKLYCKKCGYPYRISKDNKLMCSTRIKRGPRKCDGDVILVEEFEEVVLKAVNGFVENGMEIILDVPDYEEEYKRYTDLIINNGSKAEKDKLLERVIVTPLPDKCLSKKSFYRPSLLDYLRKITYSRKTFSVEFVGGEVLEVKKDLTAYPVRRVKKKPRK